MIGKLKGQIDSLGSDQVLIDVGGVCYLVFASARTLANLSPGLACQLHILTHVREDHIHLFGFGDLEEKAWFELLLTVQGVGARLALALLSSLTAQDMANALMLEDKKPFQSVSGVGPKLAARLVTELKERAPVVGAGASVAGVQGKAIGASAAGVATTLSGDAALVRDVKSALTNLGYDDRAAAAAATKALEALGSDAGFDALIPEALKALAS